jgi:N-methylhydantoinase A
VLGRLDSENFLGGEMALDEAAARKVIAGLAAELGLSETEAAEGVLTIVNANMANAIRSRTIQKGLDPRDFTLVAFGGAGPLHGAEVAAALDIPEVIIPPHPGITSASGLLTTDLKYDLLKTSFQISGAVDIDQLNAGFASLEKSLLAQYAADGLAADEVEIQRTGDLRYVGQGYELRVPVPAGDLDEKKLNEVWANFSGRHEVEYGHAFPDNPIEIVNIRVGGSGYMPKIGHPQVSGTGDAAAALVRRGTCTFRVDGQLGDFDTGYYRRDALAPGSRVEGPAVILQTDTTTVVPPGWRAEVVAGGNMVLNQGEAQ